MPTTLTQQLTNLLSTNPKYVVDGAQLKNKIIEDGLKCDPELIGLLLTNSNIKKHFFVEATGGVLVFNSLKFQQFIGAKDFLPDSFTSYKNKIGLTDGDNFISTNKSVVLDFPYKDCYLEGGQTKDDTKRKEVFFNETLAPDEIDILLKPKLFTGYKRFTTDKEIDKGLDFEPTEIPLVRGGTEGDGVFFKRNEAGTITDNLIIKGNNLLALHTLKAEFKAKVKLIYIDPPYNTGSDSFGYNDRFNHSTWLVFMKNRLEVARELLRDDGVIFVQCDYHEDAYLKVLMDEVFGQENFVQGISVKMSDASGPKMAHAKKLIPKLKDTLLIFSKKRFELVNIPKVRKSSWDNEYSKYLMNFEKKDYIKLQEILAKEKNDESDEKIVNKMLSKVKLSTIAKEFNKNELKENWYYENAWRIVADKQNTSVDKILAKAKLKVESDIAGILTARKSLVIYRTDKNFGEDGRVEIVFASENLEMNPCDLWLDISTAGGFSEEGGVTLTGGKKPESLIQRIIEMSTNPGDIVLDYHLGSGTTAAVDHKMGRQYIGVEQMDYIQDISCVRMQKVLDGEQGGISKSINWLGGGSFVYLELRQLNQQFIDSIKAATTTTELQKIWKDMQSGGFLSYLISVETINTTVNEFEALPLENQQRFLYDVLDKNNVYICKSDLENEDYVVSEEDKAMNREFYKLNVK
jgi:adenine-specific DNA-methyltransferase